MADIELSSLNGSNGFQINGETAGDWSGRSVASAGDVNGDGFDDIIIGAPEADLNGISSGASYVVFGKAGGFAANLELSSLNGSTGFQINGEATYDDSGEFVASAGDVNGDGYDDLIIGARGADPNGISSGASYVVFGKAGAFAANLELSSLNGSTGFQINGEAVGGQSGTSVASAGDVNGDGFDDLIIGAPRVIQDGSYSGASYVVFGKAGGFAANLELSSLNGSTGFRINGEADDRSGSPVASAGDVNGDGFDDLIIGAPGADLNGISSGASYVVFGKAGGFAANIELSSLNGSTGFQINGEAADDFSGRSVASAGDINGDGFDDLIIGAFGADPNFSTSGASYVVFGKAGAFAANLELSSLNGSTGFQINGEKVGDWSGISVASAGDVNSDGFDDLIIGAHGADLNGISSGASYVVFGKAGGFAANLELSSLNGSTGFQINGEGAEDASGLSAASAGDLNADGFDDLIIGAYGADPNGDSSGASYVIFGSATIGADMTTIETWNFSYTAPADMLTFAHLSADSYNGDMLGVVAGEVIRPPAGWSAILTTWDGSGAVPVDDTGHAIAAITVSAAGMQATAYREDATGRVVIAYRGTDGGNGELGSASIALGLGMTTPTTTSYLQSAVDFYTAVVHGIPPLLASVSSDMIVFTGHSLGGILAGYMSGITGAQAMIFASGPHTEIVQSLDAGVLRPTGVGLLPTGTDFSNLVSTRIDGEVLGFGVAAAQTSAQFINFLAEATRVFGAASTVVSMLTDYALDRWGDAAVLSTIILPELETQAATVSSLLNMVNLHSMPLHQMVPMRITHSI